MKILLLLSQERHKPEAIQFCLDRLIQEEEGEIMSVYILDPKFSSKIENYLSESTFVADKPGQEVSEALHKEYEKRGKESLNDICKEFKSAGIPCQTISKLGDYFELARDTAREFEPDLLVITEKKTSIVSKIFRSTDERKLKNLVKCEIKVF